jgi:hypothetical protein
MSDTKFREFTIHEVIPENGQERFMAALGGKSFVEQDSWIGFQVHVIEHAALVEADRRLEIAKDYFRKLGKREYPMAAQALKEIE